MENSLNGKSSRWNNAEENINEFEDIAVETVQNETQRKGD